MTTADVAPGVADLLSCKDAAEVLNVKKAGYLAAKVGRRAAAAGGLLALLQAAWAGRLDLLQGRGHAQAVASPRP